MLFSDSSRQGMGGLVPNRPVSSLVPLLDRGADENKQRKKQRTRSSKESKRLRINGPSSESSHQDKLESVSVSSIRIPSTRNNKRWQISIPNYEFVFPFLRLSLRLIRGDRSLSRLGM